MEESSSNGVVIGSGCNGGPRGGNGEGVAIEGNEVIEAFDKSGMESKAGSSPCGGVSTCCTVD